MGCPLIHNIGSFPSFTLWSTVPPVLTIINNLHAVTQSVAHRENFRAQLGMVYEVFIKFSERVRGAFLIRSTNLTGHLPAPQKIVNNHYAAAT